MRKLFLYCLTTLLLLQFYQPCYSKELKLKTDIHLITNQALLTRASNFDSFFVPRSKQKFPLSYEISNSDQFSRLKDILNQMEKPDSFFNVLRIYYGLDTASNPYKIRLIYLPDLAYYEKGIFKLKADLALNPVVYRDGNFETEYHYDDPEIRRLIYSYKKEGYITFNKYGVPGAALDTLRFGGDSSYAAEGMVYPFQAIEDFYDFSAGKALYIVNTAQHNEDNGVNFYKHGIVFSSDIPGKNMQDAVAADLGALCPPRCKDLVVRVVRRPGLAGIFDYIFRPGFFGKDVLSVIRWALGILGVAFLGVFIIALRYRSKWRRLKLK